MSDPVVSIIAESADSYLTPETPGAAAEAAQALSAAVSAQKDRALLQSSSNSIYNFLPLSLQETFSSTTGQGVLIAAICVLFAVFLTVFRTIGGLSSKSKKNSQPAIIIVGPQGSGKTSLYTLVS